MSPRLALSNLPERNPFFTGRELVLAQLQKALAGQRRAALSGLGGMGKTQTAVEYAHRHSDEYDYIFWATAASRETLVSSYVMIAGLLKLPESAARDHTLAVEAVNRWLTSHSAWLLILDNADDIQMAREFIPLGKNGHVLLTTRARATGAVARLVEIQEMGTEEGALFLLRRAKCIAENVPIQAATDADQATAKEITTQLDGLPLALDQAAAYIEEAGCGLSGYLALYKSHASKLLRYQALTSDYPSVTSTWALSFEKIQNANPAAAELLRCCAFLHPDEIAEEVFSKGAPELGPVLEPLGSDSLSLNCAILEILKYSLLRRDPNAGTLEIHRLVQVVLKQEMDKATQRLWAERVVRAVNIVFPEVDFINWGLCDRLLAQARVCAELTVTWDFEFPEASQILNQAGRYLLKRGHYTEAEPLFKQALAIRAKTMGPEHPDVAWSLHNLASLYRIQNQYDMAEPLYERALAIWEKVDSEDPEVARNLNSLAALYQDKGQYLKSESFLERARTIWEKTRPDQPEMAWVLHNFGSLYRVQRQYSKAESLYKQALAILEKERPAGHPDLAQTNHRLAQLGVGEQRSRKPV